MFESEDAASLEPLHVLRGSDSMIELGKKIQEGFRAGLKTMEGAVLMERTQVEDVVNHPSHYTAYKGLEVIDLTEQMNFNRGNAVKYVCRAGLKNKATEIQDLEKAVWYIRREIERLQKEKQLCTNPACPIADPHDMHLISDLEKK